MYMKVYAYRNSPGSMLQCTLFSNGTSLPLNADALAPLVSEHWHLLLLIADALAPLVSEHWHLTAMSSREGSAGSAAKRPRVDDTLTLLRPGIGLMSNEDNEEEEENLLPFGLGALPVQPQYEAIEMSTAELLQVIQKANLATVLSQHMQQAQDSCYDILLPKQMTEEWVKEHVHKVYMDDHRALEALCDSFPGDDPATKLNKLIAYQHQQIISKIASFMDTSSECP